MKNKVLAIGLVVVLLATAGVSTVMATPPGNPGVYTLDTDFDQGHSSTSTIVFPINSSWIVKPRLFS